MFKTESIENIPLTYLKRFSCGKEELDNYLKRYAKGNHKKGIGKTFVIQGDDGVVGYYTISMGSVEFHSFPEASRTGLPKYPIPVARIGRLAVDTSYKGHGVGKLLLIDALHRIFVASQEVAAYAVVVDAKDEEAKAFYKHFGFLSYRDQPLSLFIPMKTIEDLFF